MTRNRVFNVMACLVSCLYSSKSSDHVNDPSLDMLSTLSSLFVLLLLDNTRFMIVFHLTVIVMYILSCLIPKLNFVFINILPVYIAFVFLENTLILIPDLVSRAVYYLAFHKSVSWLDLTHAVTYANLITPFVAVFFLASGKRLDRKNYYYHCAGLFVVCFVLTSGNGFEYLFRSNGVFRLLGTQTYRYILWILDIFYVGIIFRLIAAIIMCYIGTFFLRYSYNRGPVHKRILRLFIPTL